MHHSLRISIAALLLLALSSSPLFAQSGTRSAEEILNTLGANDSDTDEGGRRGFQMKGKDSDDQPRITIPIQFEQGSARIAEESGRQLEIIARALNDEKLKNDRILIEGHTDASGIAAHNQALSEQRARMVERYLVERLGVSATRIEARGYGEERPLPGVSQSTEEGRARNRRVEFVNLGRGAAGGLSTTSTRPSVEVVLWHRNQGNPRPLARDGTLASNEDYRVSFTPDQDGYVYVYQIDATGKMQPLFPNPELSEANPTKAGKTYVIPSGDRWLTLDTTRGREQIVAIARRYQVSDPETIAWSLLGGDTKQAADGRRGFGGVRPASTAANTPDLFTYQFSFQHQ